MWCSQRQLVHPYTIAAFDFPSAEACAPRFQLWEATLQVLGVKTITFKDIIHSHILPAFKSDQACELPPSLLVSYWAFISLSGLLNTSRADAKGPDTADGRKLLKQLQQCVVLCTNKGPMRVGSGVAIHVPVSLGNQVGCASVSAARCTKSNSIAVVLLQCCAKDCLDVQCVTC